MSKKAKNKKNPTEKKPDKLPLRRVLQNNLYMLGMIRRAAPAYIFIDVILDLSWSVIEFFSGSFLLKVVVDHLGDGGDPATLAWFIGGMFVIHVTVFFAQQAFWQIYAPISQRKLSMAIRTALYTQMRAVELSCYEDPAYYEKYVKAMNEAEDRAFNVLWSLERLFGQVFSLVANALLLWSIDPLLMLFALIPFAVGFIRKKRNKIAFNENNDIQKLAWKANYIQRGFYLTDYAKEMRLTGMSDKLLSDLDETTVEIERIKRKYGLRTAALDYSCRISHEVVTILGACLYAVYATLVRGTVGVGDCIVVLNSVGSVSGYLQGLVTNLVSFHEHALYIENLRSFLEYEPKIKENSDGAVAAGGEIVAEDVKYRYGGAETDTLHGVSLRIAPGEKIALVGQNGSGKSTFVKLLLHLYEPGEGSITMDGVPMNDHTLASWRGVFKPVFQDYSIFALSVAENILTRPMRRDPEGEAADRALVENALRQSGAYDRVMKMPHGMDTVLTREFDDKGEVLSGGEAQKIALSRVFASDNPVVILDEPTSALDPVAEYQLFENMMEACRDRTVVFISHRLSSAVLADRVYLFEDGRVVESGTHCELMEQGGHYADMFRKQAESYRETPAGTASEKEVRV
ncbi:MAG: ABC transporter ATP-binding protein [Clostridia bacterium]|nr:ABC transporter ATP-binding protein [Clostridia bacterium]